MSKGMAVGVIEGVACFEVYSISIFRFTIIVYNQSGKTTSYNTR